MTPVAYGPYGEVVSSGISLTNMAQMARLYVLGATFKRALPMFM
jgi:hypothetical protein